MRGQLRAGHTASHHRERVERRVTPPMNMQPTRRSGKTVLEDGVIELVTEHGGLDTDEIVVHFDLVASCRCAGPDGKDRIRRLHWAPSGSDPHLSYGVLNAEALHILRNDLV